MKYIAELLGAILLRALFVAPFALLFWFLRRSAKKHHPREDGAFLEFSLAPGMLILIWIVGSALVAFTGLVLLATTRSGGSSLAALIPLSVLVAILAATPRTVSTDQGGVRQHRWFGGDRVIPWNEVAWIKRGRNTGATYIKSRNGGRPISFSPLLSGRGRFEREVRIHTGGLAPK